MRKSTVLLTSDQDKGGYVVTVPTLTGCVTRGDTMEQADGLPVPKEQESSSVVKVEIAV